MTGLRSGDIDRTTRRNRSGTTRIVSRAATGGLLAGLVVSRALTAAEPAVVDPAVADSTGSTQVFISYRATETQTTHSVQAGALEDRSFQPASELQRSPGGRSSSGFARPSPGSRVSQRLLRLYGEFERHRSAGTDFTFVPADRLLQVRDQRVVIDAVATAEGVDLKADLETLGLEGAAVYGRMVSGLLPITAIANLQEISSLQFVRAAMASTNAGLVTSQGDVAMYADQARTLFGIDGTGVTVGTISDSFDCDETEAAIDVANGDLPPGIVVLEDIPACFAASDEGRAMMQIIHDVAPGSDQAFHTGFNGVANFASGVLELASDAGADIIVDDVFYFAEPMFQDGAIAQAIDTVIAAGVPYYTAAGNHGRDSYESPFDPSGMTVFGFGEAHDFDPSNGVDLFQSFTLPYLSFMRISLQWDSPAFSVSGAPGSPNDVDIFITDEPSTKILESSMDANIGGDPIEVLQFFNADNTGATYNIVIEGVSGPLPGLIKYVIFSGVGSILEWDSNSSTVVGHGNALGAESVGAAAYFETPAFGEDPPLLEPFSSAGPTPILFDLAGSPTLEMRQKPEIVCPDGVNTTFFGSDHEPDGFPNFFGTSAAAPHAAAVAALMLEQAPGSTPGTLASAFESTAIDMGLAGVDDDSGYGLCRADLAVAALGDIFSDGFESADVSVWSSSLP